MAKNEKQKCKLLYLAKIFKENTDEEHGLTINEIIKALEGYGIKAERKSIYNDIEILGEFGLEIEMRKDKNFRYYLVGREFDLPELKLLVDSVQSSKFISHKKSMELIKKLESLTSVHQARNLSRQVYVTRRVKTMNESSLYNVNLIHDAINSNSKIRFQYFDWNVDKQKELRHGGRYYSVSPWALTTDNENYYLIAFDTDSNSIKHYRVDKMSGVKILEEKRDGAKSFEDFDLALYTKMTFSMYHGDETLVTLRCKNSLSGVVIDRFGREETFFKRGDDYFDVNLRIAVSHVFLAWVMMFAGDIEVIAPTSVREEIAKLAATALEKYK